MGRDVTDQRRAESQLQQAERLAALGQLVSGVAHEINNPAAIISGFAQTMMLDEMKADHREMVEMIYDEAGRIGKITQNLLAFARAGTPERALVDVNDVVKRTLALRAYHLTTLNIAVETVLASDGPRVWANGSQLQQLLLNLLINGAPVVVTGVPNQNVSVGPVTIILNEQTVSNTGQGADITATGDITSALALRACR